MRCSVGLISISLGIEPVFGDALSGSGQWKLNVLLGKKTEKENSSFGLFSNNQKNGISNQRQFETLRLLVDL